MKKEIEQENQKIVKSSKPKILKRQIKKVRKKYFHNSGRNEYSKFTSRYIFYCLEKQQNKDLIKQYEITDISISTSGDFMVEWKKRIMELTEEEYQEKYRC